MPPWWILCGNLFLPMAINYVYFYSIEFAKRIIRYPAMRTDYKVIFLETPQFRTENSRNALHLSEIDLPDIEIRPKLFFYLIETVCYDCLKVIAINVFFVH